MKNIIVNKKEWKVTYVAKSFIANNGKKFIKAKNYDELLKAVKEAK